MPEGICGRGIRDLNGVVQPPLVMEWGLRPSSKPHTGCSRASQESRNGKASQVQELETPPTPNGHGCVRRQSVIKCITSRCAACFMKDGMVWKLVNKWRNLRRIPFKAEHSDTKCFSSPKPCIHARRA